MDTVRTYGEYDASTSTLLIRDFGVLPPAGAYLGRLVIDGPGSRERSVSVRIVVPARTDGRYVGHVRAISVACAEVVSVFGAERASVVFTAVLGVTHLPSAAA